LAAGVAHEINNPNGLILLNTPVLQDACAAMLPLLKERQQESGDFMAGRMPFSRMKLEIPRMLAQILDGARRIAWIVDDLKNFARQGHQESSEIFSLNVAVGAALRLTNNFIKKSTDHFVLDRDESLPPVMGSAQRTEQVLVKQVLTAETPEEACRIGTELAGKLQLLLSDVVMPEMNGRDLKTRLTAKNPGMKTIFMPGYTDDIITEHGALKEGADFVQKPFSRQGLAKQVRTVLDGGRG
jgi:CheY-like chemotaxis protein